MRSCGARNPAPTVDEIGTGGEELVAERIEEIEDEFVEAAELEDELDGAELFVVGPWKVSKIVLRSAVRMLRRSEKSEWNGVDEDEDEDEEDRLDAVLAVAGNEKFRLGDIAKIELREDGFKP